MDINSSAVTGLYRVPQFGERHKDKGISQGRLRWEIFTAEENGLAASGAIVRVGPRKIFIDEAKYFAWLRSGAIDSRRSGRAAQEPARAA